MPKILLVFSEFKKLGFFVVAFVVVVVMISDVLGICRSFVFGYDEKETMTVNVLISFQ